MCQREGVMESTFLSANSSLALPQFHQSNKGIKMKVCRFTWLGAQQLISAKKESESSETSNFFAH